MAVTGPVGMGFMASRGGQLGLLLPTSANKGANASESNGTARREQCVERWVCGGRFEDASKAERMRRYWGAGSIEMVRD